MIDVRKPSEIEEGMIGVVKEFPDQKEEDFREDIIVKKISSAEFEPDGTKVELKNGSIGNLQFISHSENDIQLIKNRLGSRENQIVERKSTFAFDIDQNSPNDSLKTVLAIAVVSLMNSDGGFVYVGVKDDFVISHNDYTLINKLKTELKRTTDDDDVENAFAYSWKATPEGSLLCSEGFWNLCNNKNNGKILVVDDKIFRCQDKTWLIGEK